MKIGKHNTQQKVFIIAELSANHGGNIQVAKDTIYAAKESGETLSNFRHTRLIG